MYILYAESFRFQKLSTQYVGKLKLNIQEIDTKYIEYIDIIMVNIFSTKVRLKKDFLIESIILFIFNVFTYSPIDSFFI